MQVNSETEEVVLSDDDDQNKNEVKNANPITLISMFNYKNYFVYKKQQIFFVKLGVF